MIIWFDGPWDFIKFLWRAALHASTREYIIKHFGEDFYQAMQDARMNRDDRAKPHRPSL